MDHTACATAGAGDEFVGLCPLHPDQQPSFYINVRKNLFYCHRSGDITSDCAICRLFR
jgi:hypothetical protein